MKTTYTEQQKQDVVALFNAEGIMAPIKKYKGVIGQHTIRCWCIPDWKK